MTAREMIEQECQVEWDESYPVKLKALVSAAERVIERLRAALKEQTSRGNHHEERATEYQELLRECADLLPDYIERIEKADDMAMMGYGRGVLRRIRAALGEVQP